MKHEAEAGLTFVLRRLVETIQAAKNDGGATYDRMAANISARASDGLVREALGYVPAEAETLSAQDVFRIPSNRRHET